MTRKQSTAKLILDAALELFSKHGFKSVSMDMIASKVGIKAPSMYKHFKNKDAIFNAILQKMESNNASNAKEDNMPVESSSLNEDAYQSVDVSNLCSFTKNIFVYWTEDEFASKFRRLLIHEQDSSEKIRALLNQYLLTGPIDYLTDIFKNYKSVKDPKSFALSFYSPLFFLFSVYDHAENKEEIKKMAFDKIDELVKSI